MIKNNIYNSKRLKPIKIHKTLFLYHNNSTLNYNVLLYWNKYFFKINILNFFNHTNVLLIDEFLVFYINKYFKNTNSSNIALYNYFNKNLNWTKKLNNLYIYKIINVNKYNIYYYLILNKYIHITSIY